MTNETKTAETLAAEYVRAKSKADAQYAIVHQVEFDLLTALKHEFPQQWETFITTGQGFKAYGLEVPTSRTYDANAVTAQFGEERPDLVETVIPEPVTKVNGRAMTQLWKQLDLVPRLSKCLKPPMPKIKIPKK